MSIFIPNRRTGGFPVKSNGKVTGYLHKHGLYGAPRSRYGHTREVVA